MFHASTSDVANYRVAWAKSWMGDDEAAEEQAATSPWEPCWQTGT